MLETIPPELLLDIFTHLNTSSINLSLLCISKQIRTTLQIHPIVQTLKTLCLRRTRDKSWITAAILHEDVRPLVDPQTMYINKTPTGKPITIEEIVQRPWCTRAYLESFQAALTRTLVEVHWTPYLKRDGRFSCSDVSRGRGELIQRLSSKAETTGSGKDMVWTMFDTVSSEYSWTRVQVWPRRGKVVVRDQLSNTSLEVSVGVVELFESVRRATDVQKN